MKNAKEILVAALVLAVGSAHGQEDAAEQVGSMVEKGIESLEWGLLLEAEGAYSKTGDTSASDIVLATVEFVADAAVNDWLSGHVGLLWEEDSTENNILDEGFITMGGGEAFAVFAQAGRFYLPVGNFETAFISDPLTLELAEINQSSVMVGYDSAWISLAAGVFKGNDEEAVENVYAAADFFISERVRCGVYFLSDLMETGSQSGLGITEKNAGAGAFANLYLGAFMVNAEFVSALEDDGLAGTPMAWNFEGSMNFAGAWAAGLKVEGSDDLYSADGRYHEYGFGGVVSYGFQEHAAIGLEYMRLLGDSGEDDADLVTLQLAFEL
ncbi:LbtU family siderophore porin [Pontiella sp.]|uniref:LbtU family siderophore porin n=1 Tax=Pontiella sp. TaxID=2837462 RepID=UPI0035692989